MPTSPAFIFDLDGTLVDSVYQHVLAWHQALRQTGIELSVWRIHRKIGMSGGLLSQALLRETERDLDSSVLNELQRIHLKAYLERINEVAPLPGAHALLEHLSSINCPWAIATSGRLESAEPALEMLPILETTPIITRDLVLHAKPDPDLFIEAARQLNVDPSDAVIVGDSVWDLLAARRARALPVGLLSGGYGEEELERAGAYRIYADPRDLLNHLDEVGIRNSTI